ESYDRLYLSLEGLLDKGERKLSVEETMQILKRCRRPVVKCHAYSLNALNRNHPDLMRWFNDYSKRIYVVRDFRSVTPSLYHYSKTFESHKVSGISDFIKQPYIRSPNRAAFWNEETKDWYTRENVLFLRYEDVVRQPEIVLSQLESYLEMPAIKRFPLLPHKVSSITRMRVNRFLLRNPESTAILGKSDTRRSKTLLSAEDHTFIEQEAGEMLRTLGYL
ncbi:MAG: sulfotransferase domain-containing protein, partial [Catalinimonas sp.]